jgi:hypothetical protein
MDNKIIIKQFIEEIEKIDTNDNYITDIMMDIIKYYNDMKTRKDIHDIHDISDIESEFENELEETDVSKFKKIFKNITAKFNNNMSNKFSNYITINKNHNINFILN